jgi:hypothetical protein
MGGLVYSLLPKEILGSGDIWIRAAIVGAATGFSAALILWLQRPPSASDSTDALDRR